MRMFLFILSAVLVSLTVSASEMAAIKANNEGVELFAGEQTSEAYEKFVESLAEAPFSPIVRLNLGVTFEKSEQYQKAFQEYLAAHKNADQAEFKYYALFNAAEVLARQKKIPEALAYYQAALEINPSSREAKTNIELLIQQGGGGGKGDQPQKNQKEGEDENQEPDENTKMVNRREEKPKPFESKELSQKDVEKILEELRNQEQKVRAKQNEKKAKEKPREKDW